MAMLDLSMCIVLLKLIIYYHLCHNNNVVFIIVTFYVCISDELTEHSGSSGVEQEFIDIRQKHCHGGTNYYV